jgi:hypothetical protein
VDVSITLRDYTEKINVNTAFCLTMQKASLHGWEMDEETNVNQRLYVFDNDFRNLMMVKTALEK